MTASLRLYTGPLSMFGMKAEIALLEKGLAFDRVVVPFDNTRGYQPKHAEVVRISPKAQVPVLVHGDVEIFDSTQIFEYLEDAFPAPALWPSSPAARADARQSELIADEVYFPPVVPLFSLQGAMETEPALAAIAAIGQAAQRLERRMGARSYLAGEFSYADIAFFMANVFAERMNAPLTDATPNLRAWRARVGTRPAVRQVMTRLVGYLEETQRYVPQYLSDIATVERGSST